jgi:uncharacterized protein (TIGR02246 family)
MNANAMIRKLILPCLLACAATLAACGGAAQAPAANTAAETSGINDLRAKYAGALAASDAAALAALFTDNAVSLPDHHPPIEGRAAIQQNFMDEFAQMGMNIQIMPVDTEINGETAYERGTYTMTITPKAANSQPMKETGKYVVILKKQPNGSWLVQNDIDNTNAPMVMPAPAPVGRR